MKAKWFRKPQLSRLSGRTPGSPFRSQCDDIVSAPFEQRCGLYADEHGALVLLRQPRRYFGFNVGQALALPLEM